MEKEFVVLVNQEDQEIGLMEKMEAHEKGELHRAISVLLFNEKGEMLLQQRAMEKYHWAGIWSNACCTHPRENESYKNTAERRLEEELGIETELEEKFRFIYKAKDEESGLTEHELDAVFFGDYNESIPYNEDEVMAVKWISMEDLEADLLSQPDKYSFWFKKILQTAKEKNLLTLVS